MLKRLITILSLAAMVFNSSAAFAIDLKSSFNELVPAAAVNSPGVYVSQSRTTFVVGGVDVRFPRAGRNIATISLTPPSFSAGCGGISAHFGGFSFVSGKQIEQLIKNIAQNAVGMVVSVVIKTLCPICDAVIQAMTKLAQDAARMAVNSCEMATSIAKQLESSMAPSGGNQSYTTSKCGLTATIKNGDTDMMSAMNGVDSICGTMDSAINTIKGYLTPPKKTADGKIEEDAASEKLEADAQVGNLTWNELNHVFGSTLLLDLSNTKDRDEWRNRVLLMNVLGTTIVDNKDASGNKKPTEELLAPTVSAKHMFDLYMCGAPFEMVKVTNPDGSVSNQMKGVIRTPSTQAYCKFFYGSTGDANAAKAALSQDAGYNYDIWVCNESSDEERAKCLNPQKRKISETDIMKGPGFLPQVEMILAQAVEDVRTSNKGGFRPEFLSLVNAVNFPIYQAVNAAAVYPASASDLMSTMSILVAESLVTAKLNEMLSPHGRNTRKVQLNRAAAQRMYEVLENMNKAHLSQRESFGRMMAVQEGAVQAIRQINIAIQKEVMSPELLGNTKFSAAVVNSVVTPAGDTSATGGSK